MRLSLTLALLACFIALVAAWDKEDQEIFRLRDEVELAEGAGTTFYDFVGVPRDASHEDIIKAYRKKSKALHPDKAKQRFLADHAAKKSGKKGVTVNKKPSASEIRAATKRASERFTRLGIVKDILRGEGRERYDHFLRNGFPSWKGTDYYYARYRPGLGAVLTGLFLFVGGGGHYFALWMSWKRQQDFIGRYVQFARQQAWGNALNVPGVDTAPAPAPAATTAVDDEAGMPGQPMNRRQRRMQEKDAKKDKKSKPVVKDAPTPPTPTPSSPSGAKKRVVAENGKVLIVDSVGNVFLEQKDEDGEMQEYLLDPNDIPRPTIADTALVRLPVWIFRASVGRFLSTPEEEDALDIVVPTGETDAREAAADDATDADEYEMLDRAPNSAQNGVSGGARRTKKTKKSGKAR